MATLLELIHDFRESELDDLGGDVDDPCAWENDDTGLLWSNRELVRFANLAEKEFCRRRPIMDSETAGICLMTLSIGQATVTYDPIVEYVDRIKIDGETHELQKRTKEWMDKNYSNWEADTGVPKRYIENHSENGARFHPIPEVSTDIVLTVGRLPLAEMDWNLRAVTEPEINLKAHYDLMLWMGHIALRKRDSQTYNKSESDRYFKLFETAVGPRKSAWMEQRRKALRGLPRRTTAQPR